MTKENPSRDWRVTTPTDGASLLWRLAQMEYPECHRALLFYYSFCRVHVTLKTDALACGYPRCSWGVWGEVKMAFKSHLLPRSLPVRTTNPRSGIPEAAVSSQTASIGVIVHD